MDHSAESQYQELSPSNGEAWAVRGAVLQIECRDNICGESQQNNAVCDHIDSVGRYNMDPLSCSQWQSGSDSRASGPGAGL